MQSGCEEDRREVDFIWYWWPLDKTLRLCGMRSTMHRARSVCVSSSTGVVSIDERMSALS